MANTATWRNAVRTWNVIKPYLVAGKELVVFDLETTGLSPLNAYPIELGAIRCRITDDFHLEPIDKIDVYMKPPVPITDTIEELTGITNQFLADKPDEESVFWDTIHGFFKNDVVVGFNNDRFDNKFMENLYYRMGQGFHPEGSIDVLTLAKDNFVKGVDVKDHKLVTIASYLGIEFQAHNACEDARATMRILDILMHEHYEKSKAEEPVIPDVLERPTIRSVRYWEGFRGFSRIYVATSAGDVYYDIRNSRWGAKENVQMQCLDMDYIERTAWAMTGCTSEAEFKRFRGGT